MQRAAVVTALLLAATLTAQSEPSTREQMTARAHELLGSEELAERAWGAHWAACSGDTETTSDLIAAYARTRGDEERAQLTRRAILGALVDLGGEVPATSLELFADEWLTESLILAARAPADNVVWLERQLDRRQSDESWTAVHDLLAACRSQALVRHLLREATCYFKLRIVDQSGWSATMPMFGGAGADALRVPADYPPISVQLLVEKGTDGSRLAVDGLFPLFLQTVVVPPGAAQRFGGRATTIDRGERQFAYLYELAGISPSPRLQRLTEREIVYSDDPHYRSELAGLHRYVADGWRALRAGLVERGLLERRDADGLPPRIGISVSNRRADHSHLLPDPLDALPQVRIGDIDWITDYDLGMARAQRLERPLLVHFGEHPG